MFARLIVAVLLVSLPIISHAQQGSKKMCDPEKTLWPSNGNCTYDEDCLLRTIVDEGETALPILLKGLQDKNGECADDRQETSAYLISVIGGVKSVDALREQYDHDPQSNTERAICFAMASTGRNEDIEFLIKSLSAPDPEYDRWAAIEAASISLAILKYKDAIVLMKRVLNEDSSGLLGESLIRSIDWLEDSVSPSNSQTIQQAIISCCPLNNEIDLKRDSDTFISSDGMRALVEVRLRNQEFIYLLRKGPNWKVTGMMRVAIYD